MIELLSPAGDIECLKYAIYAGCDAVYIGGKNFGARAFAKNFNRDDIEQARYLTKLYGVKLYVTINTLIYDDEFKELTEYVRFLHKIGVDAIIVQDIGVIEFLRKKFPNLEIHASTQLNTHNKNTFELLEKLGVKRIVTAREMSLDEINKIDTKIEREIFVHGTLCVSYSGCCLLSSYIGGRSGNRGLCAGTCRLPFELYKNNCKVKTDNKYLLSMKDLYTLDRLEEILKSNVHSLKIEGRMKSKEYVYYVTKIYRKYIDMYYKYGKITIEENDIDVLKSIFNREFTNGYLFNKKDNANIKSPNNIGLYAGRVVSCNNYKCKIKLVKQIEKNDGIRIIYNDKEIGMLINKIDISNNIATIYPNQNINVGSKVYITSKNNLEVEEKKIIFNCEIEINDNDIVAKIYNDRVNFSFINKGIVTRAINNPTSYNIVEKQLKKLGNTPFSINDLKINMPDNIFINIKDLNEFRRNMILKLENKLTEINNNFKEEEYICETNCSDDNNDINYNVLIQNKEQFDEVIKYPFKRIYLSQNLYYKYKNKYNNLVLVLPRINNFDFNFNNEKLLIREIGSLKYSNNNYVVSDYTLNVTNSYSYKFLKDNNVDKITISTEINENNLYFKNKNDLEVIIYGKIELMISKYCLISNIFKENKGCKLCHNNNYYLVDRKNSKYKIINDGYCNSIILSNSTNNNLVNINKYINMGINNFRLNFYDEDINDIKLILKQVFGGV